MSEALSDYQATGVLGLKLVGPVTDFITTWQMKHHHRGGVWPPPGGQIVTQWRLQPTLISLQSGTYLETQVKVFVLPPGLVLLHLHRDRF